MTKIEAQTTDEMKIPGAALASTIKVLAGLGSVGERVLKDWRRSKYSPKIGSCRTK